MMFPLNTIAANTSSKVRVRLYQDKGKAIVYMGNHIIFVTTNRFDTTPLISAIDKHAKDRAELIVTRDLCKGVGYAVTALRGRFSTHIEYMARMGR